MFERVFFILNTHTQKTKTKKRIEKTKTKSFCPASDRTDGINKIKAANWHSVPANYNADFPIYLVSYDASTGASTILADSITHNNTNVFSGEDYYGLTSAGTRVVQSLAPKMKAIIDDTGISTEWHSSTYSETTLRGRWVTRFSTRLSYLAVFFFF